MKRGRPTKISRELVTRICGLLAKGSSIKSACIQVGVCEASYFNWQQRAKANEGLFARLFFRVTRTREAYKARLIERVVAAAKLDWRAAAWALERQFPHEFAPYDRRPIPVEPQPEKRINVAFVVDTKGKSLAEVANFPVVTEEIAQKAPEREPEPTAGELFDGNISKLGRVEHDLPFDGNGG
jgi:hypothetical protein